MAVLMLSFFVKQEMRKKIPIPYLEIMKMMRILTLYQVHSRLQLNKIQPPRMRIFPVSVHSTSTINITSKIILLLWLPPLHKYYSLFTILMIIIGGGYTAERPTDDVSSTDDHSCSTCSYTGDSGFSDSREFLKQLPSEQACHQREHCLATSSNVLYTSLITTEVQTAYYQSLNPESRISGR